jgi:predicted enzyme related to lactoylglutathione lyase
LPKIVHFEINSDEPDKAVKFYEEVFGWKIKKSEVLGDYWMATTGQENEPGIDGGIQKKTDPGATTYIVISVTSIDDYLKKIEENGGKIVTPKMSIPGIGYAAYFSDLDKNVVGIFEEDESAK